MGWIDDRKKASTLFERQAKAAKPKKARKKRAPKKESS
jgi:hypothetical protein